MATIGVSLSGGGFRASLFHTGVLKRLDELGILNRVSFISAVSGGAVTAALYIYLKKQKGSDFQFIQLERTLLSAIKSNPRTRWLVVTLFRRFLLWILPPTILRVIEGALGPLTFQTFFKDRLFHSATLADVGTPTANGTTIPRLILNTTSLEIGQDFFFTPTYIGPREECALGLVTGPSRADPAHVELAYAVAASACFPVVFPPYPLRLSPNADSKDDGTLKTGLELRDTLLIDGGVYDNQGFGVFLTERPQTPERVTYLIASDASKTLRPSGTPLPPWYNPAKRLNLLLRAHGITEDRARWERFGLLLYKLGTGDLKQSAFFHTSTMIKYSEYGMPQPIVQELARLRTDFDSFSDLEITCLMYHGYTIVDHTLSKHCSDLIPSANLSARSLQSWPSFVADVSTSIPRPRAIKKWLTGLLERRWRPYFQESNPFVPRNQVALVSAISHLHRGATTSLIWRGIQRLGDRGPAGRIISYAGKIVIWLAFAYLIRTLLILAIPIETWLVSLSDTVFKWFSSLLGLYSSLPFPFC